METSTNGEDTQEVNSINSATIIRANGIPTGREKSRIEEFIKAKQDAISGLEADIKLAKTPIYLAKRRIESTEKVIPSMRKYLKEHIYSRDALKSLEEHLSDSHVEDLASFESDDDDDNEDESGKAETCERAIKSMNNAASRFRPVISEQIRLITDETRDLQSQLAELEEELDGWRFSLKLADLEMSRLLENKRHLLSQIKVAKEAFSAVRRIPNEVWTEIFRYRVEGDFESYLAVDRRTPMNSSVLRLSHVCKRWRRMIMNESVLWRTVPGQFRGQWSNDHESILAAMLAARSGHPTVVVNLSYTAYINQSTIDNLRGTNGSQLLPPQSYSLVLSQPSQGSNYYNQIPNVGLKLPKELIIHAMPGHSHGFDLHSIPYYPSIQRLTVLGAQQLTSYNISTTMPQLTHLSFELTTFNTFNLGSHLPTTLQEFRFQHEDVGKCSLSNTTMQLQNLSVLGLTPYEVSLFKTVDMPILSTFILYSPKTSPSETPNTIADNISNFGQKIQNLEFHRWPDAVAFTNSEWTTVSILGHVLGKIYRLKRVKFLNSLVDGRKLIDVLSSRLETEGIGSTKLELTLDRCEGITRTECEEIQYSDPALVEGLKILV